MVPDHAEKEEQHIQGPSQFIFRTSKYTIMNKAEDLRPGETLLESVRSVKGGEKYEIQLAERFTQRGNPSDVIQMLNPTSVGAASARRAWQVGEPDKVRDLIREATGDPNFELPEADGQRKEIGAINPEIYGHKLNVRVFETTEPDDYQAQREAEEPGSVCKTAGRGGTILTHSGRKIFSNTQVVLDKREGDDIFLDHDQELSGSSQNAETETESESEFSAANTGEDDS